MVPNPLVIILSEAEAKALLDLPPDESLQQLYTVVREQLSGGNRKISLPDPLLGRLIRFMAWGYGPAHVVLHTVFERPLLEMLKLQPPR